MSTEQSNEAFEKWWTAPEQRELRSSCAKGWGERIWQASRAALVVELPEPHAHLIWFQAGYAPDDYWDDVEVSRSEKDKCCDGSDRYRVYSEFEVKEMLSAAGITVKTS